ncbi:ACP S-malonyltransferase [Actinocrispum sp. NPDC049592]|uniref:ACP S-malonyltransferase n=1 Tax=Actinocrispum sp. NPDC049592 TaxID=3154835 RepID=UPI00343A6E17
MPPVLPGSVVKFLVSDPVGRRCAAEASEVLGWSVVDSYLEASGEYSADAQVLFVVHCLAVAGSVSCDYVVGPSFGGRAAAGFSGALSFADTVWVTASLASVVGEYFESAHSELVTVSFVRSSWGALAGVLAEMGGWWEVSCEVDSDFFMVSVESAWVEWLARRVASVGGLCLYVMRPGMHASVLGELRSLVDDCVLSRVGWGDPLVPLVSDADGGLVRSGEGVRGMLLDGFVRAVRWPAVVASLGGLGVSSLRVAGVDALFGRVRCTTGAFEVTSLV